MEKSGSESVAVLLLNYRKEKFRLEAKGFYVVNKTIA